MYYTKKRSNMLGKLVIIALVILGAVIAYEYYIGNVQTHTSVNSSAINSKTAIPSTTVSTVHYFNFSASISVCSNGTTNYIYPINLPSNGNVTVNIVSNTSFNVKIYDNGNLIAQYTGQKYHETFQGGGKLELVFYDFSGTLNISVDEVY